MAQSKLNESLESLRAEVERLAASHPRESEHLARLVTEVEHASKVGAPPDGVRSKVREAILHFEAEHPKVTALLNDVVASVGNVGI